MPHAYTAANMTHSTAVGPSQVYILTKNPDSLTSVRTVIVRNGISFKGRMIGALLAPVGKTFITKNLRTTLRAIEARSAKLEAD